MTPLATPVAVFLYNRPDRIAAVLRQVARARPQIVFLIAEGPVDGLADDATRCAETRAVAEQAIDWECEVRRDYASTHLGTAIRPVSGISWVFEQVEEAIFLDDGCVPAPPFFRFCAELLERYRADERVMHINGSAAGRATLDGPASYHFSHFNEARAWATWRRAWNHFDLTVSLWPRHKHTGLLSAVLRGDRRSVALCEAIFDKTYRHYYNPPRLTYWHHQWAFACWASRGLGIVPCCNLASDTAAVRGGAAEDRSASIDFPLRHPAVLNDGAHDLVYLRDVFPSRLAADPALTPAETTRALKRSRSFLLDWLRPAARDQVPPQPLGHPVPIAE